MTDSMSALSKLRTICRPGRAGGVMGRPGGGAWARPVPGRGPAAADPDGAGPGSVRGWTLGRATVPPGVVGNVGAVVTVTTGVPSAGDTGGALDPLAPG